MACEETVRALRQGSNAGTGDVPLCFPFCPRPKNSMHACKLHVHTTGATPPVVEESLLCSPALLPPGQLDPKETSGIRTYVGLSNRKNILFGS